MHAASASGAISPPTVGNISAGAGGDNWASAWHDSGKMNVSSGSSNRSAVSSPPAPAAAAAAAPNPFTASNVAQLNTSPWPSSSGTSPVSQPSKNHHQQQQSQRHVPSQQQQQLQQMQQPAPPQSTFTPQWPSSSSPATNDPFNITNVNLGGEFNTQTAKGRWPTVTKHTVYILRSPSSVFIISYRLSHLLCCSWIVQVGCSQAQLPHPRVGPHFQATASIKIVSEVRCWWWRECLIQN